MKVKGRKSAKLHRRLVFKPPFPLLDIAVYLRIMYIIVFLWSNRGSRRRCGNAQGSGQKGVALRFSSFCNLPVDLLVVFFTFWDKIEVEVVFNLDINREKGYDIFLFTYCSSRFDTIFSRGRRPVATNTVLLFDFEAYPSYFPSNRTLKQKNRGKSKNNRARKIKCFTRLREPELKLLTGWDGCICWWWEDGVLHL